MQTKDNYHNCLEKRQYLNVLFNLGLVIAYKKREKKGLKWSPHLKIDLFFGYYKVGQFYFPPDGVEFFSHF